MVEREAVSRSNGNEGRNSRLEMKVIVTGSSGRVGRALVPSLSKQGVNLLGIDKTAGADLAEFHRSWVENLRGAEAVIHLAANADPSQNLVDAQRDCINATINVVRACPAKVDGQRWMEDIHVTPDALVQAFRAALASDLNFALLEVLGPI